MGRTGIYTNSVTSENIFAAVALPHLDAAFNLARWLTGSRADAEDVVQEAMVRALTYFPTYRGGSGRAWILQIVRSHAAAHGFPGRGSPGSVRAPPWRPRSSSPSYPPGARSSSPRWSMTMSGRCSRGTCWMSSPPIGIP